MRCLVLLAGLASAAPAGGLSVVSVTPARHALDRSTATDVTVTFSAPVDPATVDALSFRVFGRWSGVVPGAYAFDDGDATVRLRPARPFFPGEMVAVRLSSAIATPGGSPLAGGHASFFWTRSAPGDGTYALAKTQSTRLPLEGLVQSYGIYAGDLDRDGAPDFTIPNETADDVRVLLGDGCGAFGPIETVALPGDATPSANEGEDLDLDGDIDFATANIVGDSISVMMNDGRGNLSAPTTMASGNQPRGLTVLDAEGDGDVDLAVANYGSGNVALFRNDGTGAFAAPATFDAGGAGERAIAAVDADNDGTYDLFVGHYDSDTMTVLHNDGTGVFTVADTAGVGDRPWMVAVGDVDADGWVDAATCDSGSPDTISIVRNDGAGGLGAVTTLSTGGFPLAVDLGDLDGDGDLDVISSNFSSANWLAYRNDGAGGFADPFSLPADSTGSCATIVDYDRDGWMDIVGVDEFSDLIFYYEQQAALPGGVQAPDCAATLRVDNLASRGGFGVQPAHEKAAGEQVFVGVSGPAAAPWTLVIGAGLEPGLASAFGILNVDPPLLVALAGVTDAAGEALAAVTIPDGAPAGVAVALQAFVDTGRGPLRLTNPETVALVP